MDDLLARVRLSPQERDLLQMVARVPGLQAAQLAARMFDRRADGGPLNAVRVVYVLACSLRRKLAPLGARFGTLRGASQGYFLQWGAEDA
jgi:DNA-binding response OmpR family regulator